MRSCACTVVVLMALVAAPLQALAQNFGFETPASADDAALPERLRDLAERVLPVYQDDNRDRYLANVATLQMLIGDPVAANATRATLRERRPAEAVVSAATINDIYVEARAIETRERAPFADAYAKAFQQTLSRLDNLAAYELAGRFSAPVEPLREDLDDVLERHRDDRALSLAEAVDLAQTWFAFEARRSYGALVPPLLAEERERRYLVEEVAIPVGDEASVAATLVRPRPSTEAEGGGRRETALLEFTLDRSSRDAYEAAARGFASLLVQSRIAGDAAWRPRAPFESDGDDARAVIDWIVRQPWSDGGVGMQGEGYGGFVAWSVAKGPPAALKAIATTDPMAPGIDVPSPNGIFMSSAFRWLYRLLAPPGDTLAADDGRWRNLEEEWYREGRRYRDFAPLAGRASAVFRSWLNHPSYDRFWQKWLPFEAEFANVDVPVLTVTGYYSPGETGALHYFTEHHEHDPEANHALLIGPFDERALADANAPSAGAAPFVTAADVSRARYAWFDYVLHGAERPAVVSDTVNFALAGGSAWRHAPSLVALEANPLRLYLDDAPAGLFHRLVPEPPEPMALTDTRNLRERTDMTTPPAGAIVVTELPEGSLQFVTEPFDEPLTVAGRLRGELDFTINKLDADLVMMLYEVRADGAYVKLFEPAFSFRASYARDRVRRRLLQAGVRQTLPFQSERMMGRQLRAGSRLMLTIGVNLRRDQQINYGAGDDVSEESMAVAGAPVRIRWHEGSFIEVPTQP